MIGANPLVPQVTLAIYALLLAVGGLMGYLKAGSTGLREIDFWVGE